MAAGVVGALLPRRRDRCPDAFPRRAEASGWIQGADVQPRDGPAAPRSRIALPRRGNGHRRSVDATRAVNFKEASHLPNLRKDTDPADPDDLPRHRNGITPQMHGRYPDYNVLDHVRHWDEKTAEVVL